MVEGKVKNTDVRPRHIGVRRVVTMIAGIFFVIITLPIGIDIVANEVIRIDLVQETQGYTHPEGSYRIRRVSRVGNFSNSNGCDMIVADIRASSLIQDDLANFYAPILKESRMSDKPPLRDTRLFFFDNPNDQESLKQWPSSDLYWHVVDIAEEHENIYILLSSRAEYPPNFDGRCH